MSDDWTEQGDVTTPTGGPAREQWRLARYGFTPGKEGQVISTHLGPHHAYAWRRTDAGGHGSRTGLVKTQPHVPGTTGRPEDRGSGSSADAGRFERWASLDDYGPEDDLYGVAR